MFRRIKIDPLFCYADSNWSPIAGNDYLTTFNKVIAADYETLDCLRLFTQVFSGYSLRHARDGVGVPSFEEISAESASNIVKAMKRPDRWVRRWIRLASSVPHDYRFSPPRFLGEIGWDVEGIVVNHDTCVYQERVNLLYDGGIFRWLSDRLSAKGCLRILEIGAGYGPLALKIKSLLPACDYGSATCPSVCYFRPCIYP
jgi:hypothetical protein